MLVFTGFIKFTPYILPWQVMCGENIPIDLFYSHTSIWCFLAGITSFRAPRESWRCSASQNVWLDLSNVQTTFHSAISACISSFIHSVPLLFNPLDVSGWHSQHPLDQNQTLDFNWTAVRLPSILCCPLFFSHWLIRVKKRHPDGKLLLAELKDPGKNPVASTGGPWSGWERL